MQTNNETQAKNESAKIAAKTLEILGVTLRLIGSEPAPRTTMAEVVAAVSQYGDFPDLEPLAGAPIPESILLDAQGMSILERVLTLLADPSLDDSATVRALVEYLRGYGFERLNGLELPKTKGNMA